MHKLERAKVLIISIVSLLLFFTNPFSSFAQSGGISLQNLSAVKVDELNDEQITQFWSQAQAKGIDMSELESLAEQRGMPKQEFNKLKSRILKFSSSQVTDVEDDMQRGTNESATSDVTPVSSRIFGAELFTNKNLTFEPNMRMATPQNYQLGPDDELNIDVYGASEANYKLKIAPDGYIRIPLLGPVQVSGLTIEQARSRIVSQLKGIYAGIGAGETNVNITLGNIRSIKVSILGEVTRPGTYTLTSLATVFNALYASGGPSTNGSFRNITVIRGGKSIANIDIYEFLMKGDAKGNIRLQDQDIVKVNVYENRVELTGEVKRPGIYEVKKGETIKDVLNYAGGFSDIAYRERIKVFRNTAKERSVADIPAELFPIFVPQGGDVYNISRIIERYQNRVQITGAVFRPGVFALEPGLTVAKLIRKADGLREDAFMTRAIIYRLKDDNTNELLSFDVKQVMAGQGDIELKREDIVQIMSKQELKESFTVTITGEVLSPGSFPYADNMKVEDLIVAAGGLRENASAKRIEIARRSKTGDANAKELATVITYDVTEDLKTADGKSVVLQPFDIVAVYPLPGYHAQRMVSVEGEVVYPGQYILTRSNERISDIIKRTGGITQDGFPSGAVLLRTKRMSQVDQLIRRQKYDALLKQTKDTLRAQAMVNDEFNEGPSLVGIDLDKALKKPGSKYDMILSENDVLRIPRVMQTIKVGGEVLYPVRIRYEKGRAFKGYVSGAGGFSQRALRRRAYVIYANGQAAGTKHFLVFNFYPNIKPGAEIIVPPRQEKQGLSAQEFLGIITGTATLVILAVTLLK